jgi:phosphoribosyl 1,2-cyclic phosphate phosphodiesterase
VNSFFGNWINFITTKWYITTSTLRILIIPDEIKGYHPIEKLKNVDVAILPFGSNEVNPVTEERILLCV